ncbi:MAG: putative heme transporter, partial [Gaiellaceae bacterium]|nr:putative heme transporter [Gaiellaceae bacterium]
MNGDFDIDRRKAVASAVIALLLLAAVVWLIGQVSSFGDMKRALEQAHRGWFPVCLLGEVVAYIGYIAAYRDFARVDGGPRFSLWTVTRVVIVGFGAFVAGSSAGTLGVDYWALHKAGDEPHRAARRVLALNTLEWGVLATFACLAAAVLLAGGGNAPVQMELAWLAIVPACVAAAAWVSSPNRAERFTTLPGRRHPLTSDPGSWVPWLRRGARIALADAIGGVVLVRQVLTQPRRYPLALLGFPIFWAGDILGMYAALQAFDVHLDLAPLVLAYTTAYVITSLPLPAGGAGGVEAGLVFSLDSVGVPIPQALLATLVYRFFTLWL